MTAAKTLCLVNLLLPRAAELCDKGKHILEAETLKQINMQIEKSEQATKLIKRYLTNRVIFKLCKCCFEPLSCKDDKNKLEVSRSLRLQIVQLMTHF